MYLHTNSMQNNVLEKKKNSCKKILIRNWLLGTRDALNSEAMYFKMRLELPSRFSFLLRHLKYDYTIDWIIFVC